ncbi:gamma-butyrobetaine hydroxylase-like domain-containing protein [Oceanibacterium hippocampi]|uniref:Gamma-butyrobetaine hydroxylase-like N-terminal domain-containing protein n=1 Tax=Oceanibacterium hippocampi TaxID=745714 RepID=A0A1Y5RF28_9PROT|nr:DUF971 domain-containing protein [Oceanibacterium hippocampi]SLN16006.1 hypothetical protein OCH7691_00333 [Oceanibacterium hippocampi]
MSGESYDEAGRPAPVEIRLRQAERILDVEYGNGHRFSLPAELLRVESPSAEVQGHSPTQKVLISGRRHVGIMGVEAVGNYAVRLRFDDLHDTGIYSWAYLYHLGINQEEIWQRYLDALAAAGRTRDPD